MENRISAHHPQTSLAVWSRCPMAIQSPYSTPPKPNTKSASRGSTRRRRNRHSETPLGSSSPASSRTARCAWHGRSATATSAFSARSSSMEKTPTLKCSRRAWRGTTRNTIPRPPTRRPNPKPAPRSAASGKKRTPSSRTSTARPSGKGDEMKNLGRQYCVVSRWMRFSSSRSCKEHES